VLRTRWETRLKLHKRDVAVLHTLAAAMQFTGELRMDGDYRTLALCSTQLVEDLRKYGIVPCKTFTVPFITLPGELQLHYLRGVFDGDGSVGKQLRIVTGSTPFVNGLLRWYLNTYGSQPYTIYESNKTRVIFNRRDAQFVHALYGNATIGMPRKAQLYMQHWACYTYDGLRPKRGPYKKHKL
jgi:hypothetical protein